MYVDNITLVNRLTDEDAGKLFKAIMEYENTLIVPQIQYPLDVVFESFKRHLDENREKHKEISKARSEIGRKGGLAKASKSYQTLAKPTDSDSDSDSVSDSVNDDNKEATVNTPTPNAKDQQTPKPSLPARKSGTKDKTWCAPTLDEVLSWASNWAKEHGKSETSCSTVASEAWRYYSRTDWKDRNGKQVKNWKLKIAAVWFTDEKLSVNEVKKTGYRL